MSFVEALLQSAEVVAADQVVDSLRRDPHAICVYRCILAVLYIHIAIFMGDIGR